MRLVYLSPVDWHSFAQRPHKYVQWWHATTGGQVLWVNPYPSRLPRWSDLSRLRKGPATSEQECPPWLELLRPPAWPIEPLPGAGMVLDRLWPSLLKRVRQFAQQRTCELVIGKPSRMARLVADTVRFSHSTYDAMDDFPAFHRGRAGRFMAEMERELLPHVDTVLASSSALVAKFMPLHRDVIPVLNGFDPASLPRERTPGAPCEAPLLGYVGTIREWFDWPLVLRIARSLPHARIRLIGPLDHPSPQTLPPNVECLPACAHEVALRHMAAFSAGLIPFRLNELTAAVDPIKYYEYAALGLPVLSTAFGEMRHRTADNGVFHLDAAADLATVVSQALAWRPDDNALGDFRTAHSWSARFASAGAPAQPAAVAPEHRRRPHAPKADEVALQMRG